MGDPPGTREIPWNGGQIGAWVLLLFIITGLGALPLILQGLNLSRISQSTPHLPLVMTGMLLTSCAPTLAALFVVGLCPGAGGLRSISCQVRIWRVGIVWYGLALIGPIILLLAAEVFYAILRGGSPSNWMVLPSFSGPADPLWRPKSQYCYRSSLEHLALVVPNYSRRLLDCAWSGRGGNLHAAHFYSNHLRVDVQQHEWKSNYRHACTSRAQLGRQSRTDVGRWKLATHDYRSELSGSGDHSGLNDGAANAAPAKSRSDFERAVAPGLSIIGNPELISRRTVAVGTTIASRLLRIAGYSCEKASKEPMQE
jgi:hypothetical protein